MELAITPMDIHRHEFSTSRLGGYKAEEVDAFLDQLADELEMLLQRYHEMNESLEEMRERLREYDSMQSTIQNAFINAQKSADALVQDAKNQAEAILAEARKKKDEMLAGLVGEREKIEAGFAEVKQMVASYIGSARQLLEKQLAGLKQFEAMGQTRFGAKPAAAPQSVKPPEPAVIAEMPIAETPLASVTTPAPPPPPPASASVAPEATPAPEPASPTMTPGGVQNLAATQIEEAAQEALDEMEPVTSEGPPMFEAEGLEETDESDGKKKRHFFWE